MELKPKDRSTIERALGIIEGILLGGGISENITASLYNALNMIDEVLNKEEPT